MVEDDSIEFDMFEDMRCRLTEVLVGEGRDLIDAERIALYVMQGVRDVPKLLSALKKKDRPEIRQKILEALNAVMENSAALDRARAVMHGPEDHVLH